MEEFVLGTQEAERAPTPAEVVWPAATPKPSELETLPTLEAALPAPTPPSPEVPAAASIPVQSKESSLTHRLQAPDKEATVRFTVDMSVGRAPQAIDAGSADGAQKSGYRAGAAGGWVEGSGGVGAIGL